LILFSFSLNTTSFSHSVTKERSDFCILPELVYHCLSGRAPERVSSEKREDNDLVKMISFQAKKFLHCSLGIWRL